ncbi:Reverse transcriptase (RNA-dependent DNA polymerase) [Devosia lucknowensis]|uniref:Reverse transcriptase (RNA-dependent DNA polymerase) n=1 Tax=Devosia lucknowensis TaxID=1096929 RepID=A0A1Y6FDR2_9HYPH|nr:RNA-directed DNA polymerase [Devosia lucknowensis]SMQ70962.1 Reverse transcriptase (RNA-dependent DNA polymerase) [Devosia lucknowensis]
MADALWKKAIEQKSLEAGWHLTRSELRADFFNDFYYQQAFANFLAPQISELQRALAAGTYSPRPLRATPVPKSHLSTRPGSVIPLRDRILLWSVVRTIAEQVYSTLNSKVYSYNLKEHPKQGELFRESDVLSLPFLKKKDISAELDPFEAWYNLWPDFEDRTKEAIGEGYKFLVVSDIAAYFENINLEILSHQLMVHLKNEPKICNLLHDIFRNWTTRTHTGTKAQRGIPQGSGVCGFFGNIYLMPVDEAFQEFSEQNSCLYIRYMDDVRIFCKDVTTARKAAFLLEDETRALHLNLQSAKTKILEEKPSDKQITNYLFDDRVDELVALREALDKKGIEPKNLKLRLSEISRKTPANPESKKLHRVKGPTNNLTDRALRLWMNLCIESDDPTYIETLLQHIRTNPDQRISRIFLNTCKTFPRHSKLGNNIVSFLNSEANIHLQQEAELLRAARYLSAVPDDLWKRALSHVRVGTKDFGLRSQSLLLLGMRSHSNSVLDLARRKLSDEKDIIVQPYYMAVLGQLDGEDRQDISQSFLRSANQHCHEFGILLTDLDSNIGVLKGWLDFVMRNDDRICDWQGVLWYLAGSQNAETTAEVHFRIVQRLKSAGGRTMLRVRLAAIRNKLSARFA